MIELYAITDDPAPPLPKVAPLRSVGCDGLAAVCAPALADEPLTAETLWRHEEVVEALLADRDLLPVRYGTRLPDEDAAARAVAERREELAAALDRVRGAVELSLRVHAPAEPDTDPPATGREYLLARTRRSVHRQHVRRLVHDPLAAMARDAVIRAPRPDREALRAAYLVDRDAVDRFAALVRRLQDAHPELQLLCTGPWPPYSFVEA